VAARQGPEPAPRLMAGRTPEVLAILAASAAVELGLPWSATLTPTTSAASWTSSTPSRWGRSSYRGPQRHTDLRDVLARRARRGDEDGVLRAGKLMYWGRVRAEA
jgi:hypothetical protein